MTARLHSIHCTCFGVHFDLAASSESLLAAMFACAPFTTRSCDGASSNAQRFCLQSVRGAEFRLTIGEETAAESPELQPALELLARDLMVHVANFAPDRVFMHAGVVGWRGRSLLFPGSSFAGKTTLVAELVRAGATYYSDEYAVLDEHGRVHPYSRNLQMRQIGGLQQAPVAVEDLGGSAGTESLRVESVVFTEYAARGQWRPQPLSAGAAVLEMLRHTIPVQRTPARVMATLAAMMQGAQAMRSERGDARETALALLGRMLPQELSA